MNSNTNGTKTYTDEQRAAVQEALAQIRQEAESKGYGNYADEILSKVARNFREPHPADEAAENYATRITWSVTARAHLEDAFRAGYDLAKAPATEPTPAEVIHA